MNSQSCLARYYNMNLCQKIYVCTVLYSGHFDNLVGMEVLMIPMLRSIVIEILEIQSGTFSSIAKKFINAAIITRTSVSVGSKGVTQPDTVTKVQVYRGCQPCVTRVIVNRHNIVDRLLNGRSASIVGSN